MHETECTVKSHCYMDEEIDWLQTVKQSQDREKKKCILKLSAVIQRKMCSFVIGVANHALKLIRQ